MRAPALAAVTAALALAARGAAAAKEVSALDVCGTDGCTRIDDRAVLRGFEQGSELAEAAPTGLHRSYELRVRVRNDTAAPVTGWKTQWLPGAHLIAFDDGQPGATFTPVGRRSSARWPAPPAAIRRGRPAVTRRPRPPPPASPRSSPRRRRARSRARRDRRCWPGRASPQSSWWPPARGAPAELRSACARSPPSRSSPPRPWRRPGAASGTRRRPRPAATSCVLRAGAERTLTLGAGAARALPAGQPAAGWRSLYTATPAAPDTTVARIDVATGRTMGSLRLPGRWTLPATVIGGAPEPPPRTGARWSSRARARARPVRAGRCLAAPAAAHGRAARPLRLRRHRQRRQPDVPHPAARGRPLPRAQLRPRARRAHARRRDRQARGRVADGGPARRARGAGRRAVGLHAVPKDEGPFVHALNTEGYALCIDLPAAARSGPAAAREWGLALAPGDGVLYAANPALGLVVAIDADEGRSSAPPHPPRRDRRAPRLAVAPDGATCTSRARRRRRRRHRDAVAARHAAARPPRQRGARARAAPLRPGRRRGDARRGQRPVARRTATSAPAAASPPWCRRGRSSVSACGAARPKASPREGARGGGAKAPTRRAG